LLKLGVLPVIDPEDWLTDYAPGYSALKHSEREAIAYFCLLSSLFEAQQLKHAASASSIVEHMRQWDLQGRLDVKLFHDPLTYFKNRYFSGGDFTHLFHDLIFRSRDRRPLVEDVLRGANQNARDSVIALMLIVYRLRNNLFHGEKWDYGLEDQEVNFKTANRVLTRALEIRV
jgi:hypothetical protein